LVWTWDCSSGCWEWRLGQAVDERDDAIGDLLGLFERNQVAAVADYLSSSTCRVTASVVTLVIFMS